MVAPDAPSPHDIHQIVRDGSEARGRTHQRKLSGGGAGSHLADPIPVSETENSPPNEGYHQSPRWGCDTKSHRSVYHKRKLLMMMFFFKCTNIKSGEGFMSARVCGVRLTETSSCITLLRRRDVIISLENWG